MSCLISNSTKADKIIIACHSANEEVKYFIEDLKEDLETLKGESFQRHDPEYYDEVSYYNNFHQLIPQSLILSKCYSTFITVYREQGKSLYEAISAFLEEYEKERPKMYMMRIRQEMFPLILSGKKTSTSRQGLREIKIGQELRFLSADGDIADTIVTNVEYCKFDELTEEEAFKEGYSSLDELKDILRNLYDVDTDPNFTLIEFKLVESKER